MITEIMKDIYWVGAVDWNVRHFHGHTYSTHRGTTYNAYLIVDKKIALVDTVYGPFADEMINHIKEIVDPTKIDYLISNHVETDHSGSLPAIKALLPQTPIYCTQKGKEGLSRYYSPDWDYRVVKTGDDLSLGKYTLSFLEAPMLHWPDSMFTYIKEEALLLPNDAFGQHIASSERYTDEIDQAVLMDESAKYYANILLPLSPLVVRKIEEVQKANIPIKMIAPSHGLIWRKDPTQIIKAYLKWAKHQTAKRVVIVYDTMWQSTDKMAHALLEGVMREGIEAKLFKISESDRSDVIKEILDARGVLIGSSTINNDSLPTMAGFLEDLKGLKPRKRLAAAFGSYGWGGGAVKHIEEVIKQAGMKLYEKNISSRFAPGQDEIANCIAFGQEFAKILKSYEP